MHQHEISNQNEKKILFVIILTLITMFFEILYGYLTHSMALLADGFHMGTHVLALSLTYIAYILIRKYENSPLFPNGTNKIGILSGYTSAIFLAITGFWIIYEAIERLLNPLSIQFNEAIIVAIIGLTVNGLCIFILENKHHHHENKEKDYNFISAYYHILADILTSILAISALLIGKYFNILYFDSLIGVLGGILILKWSINLIKDTVRILLDMK